MGVENYLSNWVRMARTCEDWKYGVQSNLLTFYDYFNKLIEASWLICHRDYSKRPANLRVSQDLDELHLMNPDLYCLPERQQHSWKYFPRALDQEEYLNPYQVFSRFFDYLDLGEWKKELHHLLHVAFTNNDMEELSWSTDIVEIKSHLSKLSNACHLIYVREFDIEGNEE